MEVEMKQKIMLIVIFAFILAAMNSCKKNSTPENSSGYVVDASMNNITIVTAKGDTLNISTMDADPQKVIGVALGDTVNVTYTKYKLENGNVLRALELKIIGHVKNISVIGSWVTPNPINSKEVQGMRLKEDGTAVSINMATLVFQKWKMQDKTLILTSKSIGNKQEFECIDTLQINKLDADSLVLSQHGEIIWALARQDK